MKKLISRYYIYAVIALWAVACFVFFQYYYPYHFFYKEQNQIFMMSWSYVSTYFSKPAWAACLIGDFLTQFYYYLYAGAIILTVSLLLMGDIMRRALQKAGLRMWLSFAIAIVAMTLEATCHFYENFRLSSTIAIIGGGMMFLIMNIILKMRWMKKQSCASDIGIIIFAALSFWMFGYGCFVFIIIANISGFSHSSLKGALIRVLYIPLLLICIPILMQKQYILNTKDILTYPGIGRVTMPNMDFEKYLEIDNEYYFKHYNKVLMLAKDTKDKFPEVCFFYNLALAHQGLLADYLSLGDNTTLGTFYKIGPETSITTTKMMNELYYLIGDMTFAERAAIIANTSSPDKRNVRMMKRLAEVNLVSNDIPAAMKYLRILSNTIVYREWAVEHTPGTQTSEVKAEIAEKRQYVNKSDTIRTNDDCHTILIELLASNPKNKIALDYLLCSDLVAHDIGLFKSDYDKYYHLQKRSHKEFLYTQALKFYEANKPNNKQP